MVYGYLNEAVLIRTELLNGLPTAVDRYRPVSQRTTPRLFNGTFYINIADAQIVKFYGEIQNRQYLSPAPLTNLVTIYRQKSSSGFWLTSQAQCRGLFSQNNFPFTYQIRFNYKITDSNVQILEETTRF
ncbi:MAG TPA: hypothetical protein PKY82_35315 [Pyrinomonadaceae bacterium]|nr:hypothetical protein [Pyrinomonadaceae bacterium]